VYACRLCTAGVTAETIFSLNSKRNSKSLIVFFDHLLAQHTGERPLVIVLDNTSSYHSQTTQAAFAIFEEHLPPLFLSSYCPQLNPIERY